MKERRPKSEGVHAKNSDYLAYDQVEKRQSYSFSEQADGSESFDEEFEIKTCDLARFLDGDARERATFAAELNAALREIGFAILTGHPVDLATYAACETEVERLFTGHSLQEKLRFRAARHGSVNQGYFPLEETSDIHPDLVEGWVFCRRAFQLAGEPVDLSAFWPDPAHHAPFQRLLRAHEQVLLPVMQAILQGLGCDPHLFDERLSATNLGLRLNYYPPVPEGARGGRLLGHEDVDLFTLLPAPTSEGLQVLNRRNFRWIRLDAPHGSIVLNTGDYMQRITNDILPSTTHRVSLPREPALRSRSRVSFATNVYLWEDDLLEVLPGLGPPKYAPIRAEEFHTRTTAKYYGDDYAS